MKKWMVEGVVRYEGTDATTRAPVDSEEASTVYIHEVVVRDGVEIAGPIVLMYNEDRYGYVDPDLGEEMYAEAVRVCQEIVDWHNSKEECS